MSAPQADLLVAELARRAVERAAPEEMPLFRATSEAWLADPSGIRSARGRDDMLGFGIEAAAMLVTPVALQVARDVFDFVVAHLRERARDEGEEALDGLVDRVLDRGGHRDPAVELTDEQLVRVRALAVEKARALRLSEAKAELLADSLVGSLATA